MSKSENVEYIEHDAVVKCVDAAHDIVRVAVTKEGECDGCPAARLCAVSGDDKELIDVVTPHAAGFHAGDAVVIRGSEQMEKKAILLATVIPCICLVAIMVLVYVLTANQLFAAVCGLGAMIIFFAALYLARNRIAHEFVFTISRKN